MSNYRRSRVAGATYFLTGNLLERHPNYLLVRQVEELRKAVWDVRDRHLFQIDGGVAIPNHLHAIWTLPPSMNRTPILTIDGRTDETRGTPSSSFQRRLHNRPKTNLMNA